MTTNLVHMPEFGTYLERHDNTVARAIFPAGEFQGIGSQVVLYHVFKITVSGGNHSDIKIDGPAAADPFNLFLLKHPQ